MQELTQCDGSEADFHGTKSNHSPFGSMRFSGHRRRDKYAWLGRPVTPISHDFYGIMGSACKN